MLSATRVRCSGSLLALSCRPSMLAHVTPAGANNGDKYTQMSHRLGSVEALSYSLRCQEQACLTAKASHARHKCKLTTHVDSKGTEAQLLVMQPCRGVRGDGRLALAGASPDNCGPAVSQQGY